MQESRCCVVKEGFLEEVIFELRHAGLEDAGGRPGNDDRGLSGALGC